MQTENFIEEGDGTNNNRKPSYIKEQNNYNCQQFFGNISNCTFTMPSSSKDTETAQKKTAQKKKTANTHSEKQHGIEYPVFSKGIGVTDAHITLLYDLLVEHCWIDTNHNAQSQFALLFSGGKKICEVKFTGISRENHKTTKLGKAAIYQLFKTLWDENLIETDKEKKTKVGPILETHLTDMDGNFLTDISHQSSNVSAIAKSVIDEAVKILRSVINFDGIYDVIKEDAPSTFDRYGI